MLRIMKRWSWIDQTTSVSFAGLLAGLVALALLASGAAAVEDVDETRPAPARGTVVIENIAGTIEVIGWDRDEIRVQGILGEEVKELEFDTGKKKSRIKVVYPRKVKTMDRGAELVIHIPEGSRVEVDCVSCPIDVSGVMGRIYASSVSGDVTIEGGEDSVEAESISGRVLVASSCEEISATSISGKVVVEGEVCNVEAGTVSGPLKLNCVRFVGLEVESVTGSANVSGDLDPTGSFSFDLHSGDLMLTLPADVSAEFEIETFSGDIDNDFGGKARKVSKYAPGRELEFSTGGGEARVRINTFSGDVEIRKK